MQSDNQLHELLTRARTIAVVGLSDRQDRPSFGVASFLQRKGYRIIPVNPNLRGPVLGEQPYASLCDVREHIDIVNVFRRSEFLPAIVEDAIAANADAIWTQLDVVNFAAAQRARAAGLEIVMDRCIAIEHRRLSRYAEALAF